MASLFSIVQTKEDLLPESGKIANGPEGRKIWTASLSWGNSCLNTPTILDWLDS